MSEDVKHCLNILRRTPPSDVNDNLERIIALRIDLDEELCQRVDTPLELEKDTKTQKDFVLCDYNRDGDSYRSPWSNEYYPALDASDGGGFKPSDELRKLEIEANNVFEIYRHQYFEGGVSSVYMWDMDDGFAACFCIRKDAEGAKDLKDFKGSWSSVHVFEVTPNKKAKVKDSFTYRLTSTVLVSMPLDIGGLGEIDLSGSITKQRTKEAALKTIADNKESHVEIMGPMLEELELDLRNTIEGVYFQKTKEIINGMRVTDAEVKKQERKMAGMAKQAATGK
jgi:capping protein beta